MRAGLGWPLDSIGQREAEIGRASHAGYTLQTGEPVVVEDWAREERFRQPAVLAAVGVRSGASVVIGDPGAPYGVLAAHSVQPGAVGPEHVMFLQAVANVLDSAVARLRAEEQIAEQAAARGRLVAQALDAEERTRREISAMLHDGPLQDLLALNHALLRLEEGGEHLDRARAGIGRAIGALREIMVDLHPVAFEVAGLESALGAVADQQARHGAFACDLEVDPLADGVNDDLVIALAREMSSSGAVAVDGDGGELGFDLGELVVGEVEVGGAEVLLDLVSSLAGAGDGDEDRCTCAASRPARPGRGWRSWRRRTRRSDPGAGRSARMFAASKRVMTRRTSSPAKVSSAVTLPERKPLASGLNGTNPMPSSSQAGMTSVSTFSSMIEYSLWIAVIGVTACARRICSTVA